MADGVAAGVLDAAEVLDGEVVAYPHSRSNVVHRVERRGIPVAFVKQRGAASFLDGDDAVACERTALDSLAGSGCVPSVLPVEGGGAVWVEAVPGHPLGEIPPGGSRFDAAIDALAVTLVGLHTWPVAAGLAAPVAPRPWVLQQEDLPPSMLGSLSATSCTAVLDLTREPQVSSALAHAARMWTESRWMHGDVSAGNVILHEGSVTLVDLEGAGLGDPSWDLASAVALLHGLGRPADHFLTAYWNLGGPARLDDALLTARALQTAWQMAILGLQREDASLDGAEQLAGARRHAASFVATGGGR